MESETLINQGLKIPRDYIERMEVPPFGHTYDDWRVIEELTCVSEGQMQRMCTYCGMAEYEAIPCTGHTYGSWSISREAGSASMGEHQAVCTVCGAVITAPYYPNGSLYRGMGQNDAVKIMQQKLIDMSFLNNSADGVFGNNTEAAVRAFQAACGLEQTGIAFPQTMDMLEEKYEVFLTEQEQKKLQSGTSFCILYPGELDGTHIAYCDTHYPLYEQENMLLQDKEVQEVDSSVYRELSELWQKETEKLYDEWAESTTEDRKADVEKAKASFMEYAKVQRSIWELEYPSDPEIVEWKVLGLWEDYCIRLCSHMANLVFLNTGGDL